MSERRLDKTWEAAAYDRELGEWVHTELHSYDETEPFEWQATPARITPSRAKREERDYRDILAFSDPQIGYRRVLDYETNEEELVPMHDERKIRTAHNIARALRPELLVNLSDTIDLGEMSRFAPDSDQLYRTLFPSFQRVHDMYAQFRADLPDTRMVEVSSNHNERFNKTVMSNRPQMYGVKRPGEDSKYPVLSYPYMSNLEHVDVEWIGGYPAGEFHYKTMGGHIIRFAHGTENSSKSSSAATKAMNNHPETHNVQGHDHKVSEAWHTLMDGTPLGSFIVGALCKFTGEVPSYHSAVGDDGQPVAIQENWSTSLLYIRDYEDGNLEFNRIMINPDGSANFEGRRYDGDS